MNDMARKGKYNRRECMIGEHNDDKVKREERDR